MSLVNKKWKTLSQKLLVKNKYIELWEDQVQRPDGGTSVYYIQRKDPYSIIIPYTNDKKLVLVRQYRYSVDEISLEFPMGSAEGKGPVDTAITELKEETGITAGDIKEIGKFWTGVGRTNQSGYIYLAQNLQFGKQHLEDGEFIEQDLYSVEDVDQKIKEGEILDGPSIIAFHFLEKYLKENSL